MSALPYVKLYTSDSDYNVGIISFRIFKDAFQKEKIRIHPHDMAHILADNGVAVRAGHHCAPIYMKYIDEIALTRASIYFYNTKEDINMLISAIDKAWKKLG